MIGKNNENITWNYVNKLSNREEIGELESMLNKSLPVDYTECILENNGGYPSLHVFETETGMNRVFGGLLSLIEDDDDNIHDAYSTVSDRLDREDVLPFAVDPAGNYICFDFSANPASVVFWEHETNNLDKVSDTFNALINMLREK